MYNNNYMEEKYGIKVFESTAWLPDRRPWLRAIYFTVCQQLCINFIQYNILNIPVFFCVAFLEAPG